ncbi:MAG: nucleoside transporter [Candidatus Kuenenia sp.]|nr:nucleoside transporter [Candidatus Kuenenia hertensis]
MEWYNLVSFSGIFVLMGLAWVFSSHKRLINWRVIIWGLIFQMLFALFVFLVPAGAKMFLFLNNLVVIVMDSATEGAKFVFGRLAIPPGIVNSLGESSMGFFFAFQSLPTIIFFSALMAILYYVGVMSFIIRIFAFLFTKFMNISGAESLSAASNIFVGVESTLTIKPHLSEMTRSELCTVLTVGMATVSSNILAVYVFSLKDLFPAIAGHLISASFLSAPAALIMSKIILPESETPKTLGKHIHPHYEKERNVFEAVINGANAGVKLIVGIVALLIAVLGLVALINVCLQFFGGKLNLLLGIQIDWSLKGLLGYLFYPLTIIIGVPVSDAGAISKIIGERAIVTELTAYRDLADVIGKDILHHPRSVIIATYALCGFAHIASLAIFMGSIAALIPNKIHIFTQIGFRPLIAATLACLMTACIAGTFYTNTSLLLGK